MSKFLVIGCGSIGERHIKNLLSLGQEVWVWDTNIDKMIDIGQKYNVNSASPSGGLASEFDALVICTPPTNHLFYAWDGITYGNHIFVEKPISNSLLGIDVLIKQAREENIIIQVGYQFRFHPGLLLVKKLIDEGRIGKLLSIQATFGQYLPDWHPDEDYRNLYTSHEDQGGGIILDASHEIDYCRWLSGSEVKSVVCFADKRSSLEVDVEDNADILLRTDDGPIINIHIDFNSRAYVRNCTVIGTEGTITWDYGNITVGLLEGSSKKISNLIYDSKDMYLEEMKHFLRCIEGKETPIVDVDIADGETGKRVLEIALAAKESSRENRVMEL